MGPRLTSCHPPFASCPWSHRGRIALKLSDAEFDIVEIDLANKPAWYANINAATKVI
jgi:glutathione S-transferase